MTARRLPLSFGIVLLAGVGIGWGLAGGGSPRRLLANGADRWGDRAIAAGPIAMEPMTRDVYVPLDALYYLNYSTGKLLATVPSIRQVGTGSQVLTDFAERDLLADFAVKPGTNPRFLMTTTSLGSHGAGWAPLMVIETETGQIATYKVTVQVTAGSTRPVFALLDRRTDARLGRAVAASASR